MRVLLGLVVVVLVLAGPARAATVSSVPPGSDPGQAPFGTVVRAGPGETNQLDVRLGLDGVVVQDPGAGMQAGVGCRQIDPATATCPRTTYGGYDVYASLSDGDDTAQAEGPVTLNASGGDGSDRLLGGDGSDRLDGGPGDDVLQGGAGSDRLVGGLGADILDGGPGFDAIDVEGTVDLQAGVQVGFDAIDELESVENTLGGSGRLEGSDGPNQMIDGLGEAVLDGRGGNDVLLGGGLLLGGAGDDTLFPIGQAEAECGDGRDIVHTRDGRARVDATCEEVALPSPPPDPNPARVSPALYAEPGGRVGLDVFCRTTQTPTTCRMTLQVGGGPIALQLIPPGHRARLSTIPGPQNTGGWTPVAVSWAPRSTPGRTPSTIQAVFTARRST